MRGLPPLAGCALKLVGILVIFNSFPFFLRVLIFSSIVRLYYYLTIFINRVVRLGAGRFDFYRVKFLNLRMASFIILFVLVNWFGGLPIFMLGGRLLS